MHVHTLTPNDSPPHAPRSFQSQHAASHTCQRRSTLGFILRYVCMNGTSQLMHSTKYHSLSSHRRSRGPPVIVSTAPQPCIEAPRYEPCLRIGARALPLLGLHSLPVPPIIIITAQYGAYFNHPGCDHLITCRFSDGLGSMLLPSHTQTHIGGEPAHPRMYRWRELA